MKPATMREIGAWLWLIGWVIIGFTLAFAISSCTVRMGQTELIAIDKSPDNIRNIHFVDPNDICPVFQGEPFIAEKDGFFFSKEAVKKIMEAKVAD